MKVAKGCLVSLPPLMYAGQEQLYLQPPTRVSRERSVGGWWRARRVLGNDENEPRMRRDRGEGRGRAKLGLDGSARSLQGRAHGFVCGQHTLSSDPTQGTQPKKNRSVVSQPWS